MVNNALLGLAAVVLVSVFGVGVFVGMQVAGGGIAAPAEPTATATPAAASESLTTTSTSVSNPDPTATGSPTLTPTQTEAPTAIPANEFDERNISGDVLQYLNENRTEQGLDSLTTEGNTADVVGAMAQNHTDRMAEARELAHTIDGVTSEDRYENYNIESTCSFDTTETPSGNELEAIARTVAGQRYTEDGEQRYNEADGDVARALVDEMLADDDYRERLLQPNAGRVGIGVAITESGEVYATVNTCS